jgi:hypothetical protein
MGGDEAVAGSARAHWRDQGFHALFSHSELLVLTSKNPGADADRGGRPRPRDNARAMPNRFLSARQGSKQAPDYYRPRHAFAAVGESPKRVTRSGQRISPWVIQGPIGLLPKANRSLSLLTTSLDRSATQRIQNAPSGAQSTLIISNTDFNTTKLTTSFYDYCLSVDIFSMGLTQVSDLQVGRAGR